MGYNLLIKGEYWGHNPLTNHLQISWDIQVWLKFNQSLGVPQQCRAGFKATRKDFAVPPCRRGVSWNNQEDSAH